MEAELHRQRFRRAYQAVLVDRTDDDRTRLRRCARRDFGLPRPGRASRRIVFPGAERDQYVYRDPALVGGARRAGDPSDPEHRELAVNRAGGLRRIPLQVLGATCVSISGAHHADGVGVNDHYSYV